MKSYKSGQVSAQLFTSKGDSTKQNGLASLFAPKPSPKPVPQSTPTIVPKSTPKIVIQSNSKTVPQSTPKTVLQSTPATFKKERRDKKVTGPSKPRSDSRQVQPEATSSPPYIHETLLKKKSTKAKSPGKPERKRKLGKDEDEESLQKRPRRDRMRFKGNDSRTIFVGNCPLSADRKALKSLFKEFGEIESIRFRCAPPADLKMPKRAIVITKNYHEQCKNYVSYIVYKEEEAAKKACARNGYLLDGLHLRVDIASMSKKHDKKRSIFVGNLPFDITEEDLYSHFEDCGDITNVRLIRDRQTSLGKGIGYVQFDSKDSVSLALKLNKTKVRERELRVMVCTNKPEKQGKDDKKGAKKKGGSEKKNNMKQKKPSFAPSNSTAVSFQDKFKIKREKRLRKMEKKRELAKKSEGLTSDSAPFSISLVKKGKGKPKDASKKKNTKVGKKFAGQNGKKFAGQKGKKFAGQKGKKFSSKGKAQKGNEIKKGKRKS